MKTRLYTNSKLDKVYIYDIGATRIGDGSRVIPLCTQQASRSMVTIKHIAAILRVSPSTVGRALAEDARISRGMKQKVQDVANEIGYVPSRAARMMRGVPSTIVALIVPDIRNIYYATIAHALSKCFEEEGLQLTLSETDDDPKTEVRHLRELISANVAGIILVPSTKPLPETVRLLKRMPHIQLVREHASLGEQWFGMDDELALRPAVEHLLQLGHRRVAYVGPSIDLPTGAARLESFRRTLAAANCWDPRLQMCSSTSGANFGAESLRRLLALPMPPTALVLGAVQHTYGVLDECTVRALQVPGDLSIVGFGDEAGFSWWRGGLTTMGLPISEMAMACGVWFVHQLRQRPVTMPRHRSTFAPKLIIRSSTRLIPPPTSGLSRSHITAASA